MAGFNQTIIVGNVGRDAELRYLPSGRGVASFSVAVTRKWTDRTTNEKREETTWFNVSVWGDSAETAKNLVRKGQQIMVTGRVSARAYANNAGEPAASLDLNADVWQLLGSRGDSNGDNAPAADADSIPF